MQDQIVVGFIDDNAVIYSPHYDSIKCKSVITSANSLLQADEELKGVKYGSKQIEENLYFHNVGDYKKIGCLKIHQLDFNKIKKNVLNARINNSTK